MQELAVLSQEEFTTLKTSLKAKGLDLCYSAPSARPIRMRWSPERLHDAKLLAKVTQRRPKDPSYRIASVAVTDPGNWLRPARLGVTFYAASAVQDDALGRYLQTHLIRPLSSATPTPDAHSDDPVAVKTYVQVALVLALMTAAEVALLYLPDGMRPPRWSLLIVLLLLSAFKFGIVASFFMHLRYDHRLYAGFFVGGLVVAASTMFALLALFREPAIPLDAVAVAEARPLAAVVAPPTRASPLSDPEASSSSDTVPGGRQVFQKNGCGACHAVSAIAGAQGRIGPALDGLAQRAATRLPDQSAEAYIRQSIEAPNAYVVKGYLKLMPQLRNQMSDIEFTALVNWLRTL
jgi:cytochrome c oxidase subunit 4